MQIISSIINYKNKYHKNAVSISYIIKNLDYDKETIYQCIHDLVDKNFVRQVYSSACPNCGMSNISKDEFSRAECSFCHEIYFPYDNDEKFMIESNLYERENKW